MRLNVREWHHSIESITASCCTLIPSVLAIEGQQHSTIDNE